MASSSFVMAPNATHSTLYMPVASPPTPAPSPGPQTTFDEHQQHQQQPGIVPLTFNLPQNPVLRRQYLTALLSNCTPSELLFISTTIAPMLKRDFLRSLPVELALHILSFIDDPKTLGRAMQVSKCWYKLVGDESVWKRMCEHFEYDIERLQSCSHRQQFKYHYTIMMNWRHGGRLLRAHRVPTVSNNPDSSVITSVSLDDDWLVVGLANARIHVFSANTGVLARTLVGHDLGVWAVCLVSAGGQWKGSRRKRMPEEDLWRAAADLNLDDDADPNSVRRAMGLDIQDDEEDDVVDEDDEDPAHAYPGRPSYVTGAADGWGQPNSLVVSGGCDKVLRVWDAKSGYCIYSLQGHTSTIRCIKVLHNRPIAISGSRDSTLRVWDVQKGVMLRVLVGHTSSVRCLDACGNRVVSASYDTTCRVWNVDTGECLHVLRGHFHQLYSVVFDGVHIASGGLDTTVRLWDAETGECLAILGGHTALVCQLQLSPTLLASGGSDGRVITFSLSSATYPVLHRIAAHDSSVTSLQFDSHFLVTAGNDGRVRLFETKTGAAVRELSEACESVWKVVFREETYAVMCRRAGKTVMEIWSLKPGEGE